MEIFLEFWIAIMVGILVGWLLTYATATRKQTSPEETKLLKENQRLAQECVAMSKLKGQLKERHDNTWAAAEQSAKQRTQQTMNLEYGKFQNTAHVACATLKRNEHAKLEKIKSICTETLEKVETMQTRGQNVQTIINLLIVMFPKIKDYLDNPKQFLRDRQKKAAEDYARTCRVVPRWDRFNICLCIPLQKQKRIARWENMSFSILIRTDHIWILAMSRCAKQIRKNKKHRIVKKYFAEWVCAKQIVKDQKHRIVKKYFDEWVFQHLIR